MFFIGRIVLLDNKVLVWEGMAEVGWRLKLFDLRKLRSFELGCWIDYVYG